MTLDALRGTVAESNRLARGAERDLGLNVEKLAADVAALRADLDARTRDGDARYNALDADVRLVRSSLDALRGPKPTACKCGGKAWGTT